MIERTKTVLSGRRTFGSLGINAFAAFFIASFLQFTALFPTIYEIHRLIGRVSEDPIIINGLASLIRYIPILVFALAGGVLADRFRKKRVLMLGSLILAVLALVTALTYTIGQRYSDMSPILWVCVLLQGSVLGLILPSLLSIMSELTGRERLLNAVSLYVLLGTVTPVIAPYVLFNITDDLQATPYLTSVLFIISAALFNTLPGNLPASSGINPFSSMKAGIVYIKNEKPLLLILLLTLLITLFAPSQSRVMRYLVDIPAGTYDYYRLSLASALGVLLVLSSMQNRRRGTLFIASGLVIGLSFTITAVSDSWVLAIIPIVLLGAGQVIYLVLGNTLLQYYAQEEYRGRLMSIFVIISEAATTGTIPFLVLLAGSKAGYQSVVGTLAVVLAVVTLPVLLFVPRLRKLD